MDMDTDTEINMDTDMDTETDEQVFIKSPHLEIVAPWLAYRREGVYYFAYHEAYADVAFIALLEQEDLNWERIKFGTLPVRRTVV